MKCVWREELQKPCKAHGKMDHKFCIFHEKLLFVGRRDRNTTIFPTTFPSPILVKKSQGTSTDFWVSFGLCCSSICPGTSCIFPTAWSIFPPWLFFWHNLGFSWEKETFGASSTAGEYKQMPRNCRNISWNVQTKLRLGAFSVKIRNCYLIFGKKPVSHRLGFSCAFPVQGINGGSLHPKKLPWCNIVSPLWISLRPSVFWRREWNLGLHNPTRDNCSNRK